jgi:hypothetical protein
VDGDVAGKAAGSGELSFADSQQSRQPMHQNQRLCLVALNESGL